MKKENQLAILQMAAVEFNSDNYSSRIITDSDGDSTLVITRDFIRRTQMTYTVNDIINMSLKNGGNVFSAILEDISNKFRQESHELYKNLN